MEANARNTSYTLLGSDNTAPLRLAYEDAPAAMDHMPTLLGVRLQHPRGMGTRGKSPRGIGSTSTPMSTILSFAWESRRDTLRALYIALPRAEATHGVSAWCLDASPTSRCTLDPAK
ncbi:hypothetical protein TcBrA4_0032080 [Trypanosoma cruzi]|nr:hypothetical protein TcBrA4_0032080 [Trypanosoma cruzi]